MKENSKAIVCEFSKRPLNTIIALTHSDSKTDDISPLDAFDQRWSINYKSFAGSSEIFKKSQFTELRKYLIFTILCQLTYANSFLSCLGNLFDFSPAFFFAAPKPIRNYQDFCN